MLERCAIRALTWINSPSLQVTALQHGPLCRIPAGNGISRSAPHLHTPERYKTLQTVVHSLSSGEARPVQFLSSPDEERGYAGRPASS